MAYKLKEYEPSLEGQTKTVTYTENGSYTITPDSGKKLTQANITVNVPSPEVSLSSLRVDGDWTNKQTKGASVDITGLVPTATFNTSISTPVSTTLSGDGAVSGYTYSPQTWGTDATQTCTFSYTYNSVTKTATKQYKLLAPGDVGPGGGVVVQINGQVMSLLVRTLGTGARATVNGTTTTRRILTWSFLSGLYNSLISFFSVLL